MDPRYASSLKHAADMVHPLLDSFAAEYYLHLPQALWPSVGVTATERLGATWDKEDPDTRAQFRAVALRFINGDETLAIWRLVGC